MPDLTPLRALALIFVEPITTREILIAIWAITAAYLTVVLALAPALFRPVRRRDRDPASSNPGEQ